MVLGLDGCWRTFWELLECESFQTSGALIQALNSRVCVKKTPITRTPPTFGSSHIVLESRHVLRLEVAAEGRRLVAAWMKSPPFP